MATTARCVRRRASMLPAHASARRRWPLPSPTRSRMAMSRPRFTALAGPSRLCRCPITTGGRLRQSSGWKKGRKLRVWRPCRCRNSRRAGLWSLGQDRRLPGVGSAEAREHGCDHLRGAGHPARADVAGCRRASAQDLSRRSHPGTFGVGRFSLATEDFHGNTCAWPLIRIDSSVILSVKHPTNNG